MNCDGPSVSQKKSAVKLREFTVFLRTRTYPYDGQSLSAESQDARNGSCAEANATRLCTGSHDRTVEMGSRHAC